ncbi:MAG: hypothetical protein LQ347_001170 [Umbilicaria vellea]|nr:MAG: hypothetical protein LQ347_001170 [Umbilicaria vellea]
MAAVGEFASILTIAQSAKQLYDFVKSVEDAPKSILEILEDLRVFQTIIEQIEYDKDASPTQLASAVKILALCKLKMQEMELLLEDLGLESCSKRRRTWASIKAVLRKEKIEAFRSSLESAKATLLLARGVFTEQANRRDLSLLTASVNEVQSQHATRESINNVVGRVERVQEHLAYQQNSINTVIASQKDIEQHIIKVHFGINQVTQTFGSTTDSLAQPFIRNALKYSITEIAREALQDPAMRRELSRLVTTPQETASTHLQSTSFNDSHDDFDRPASTPAANVIECYNSSQGYDMCAMLIQAGAPVDATEWLNGWTPFLTFGRIGPTQSEIEREKVTRLFLEEGKTDIWDDKMVTFDFKRKSFGKNRLEGDAKRRVIRKVWIGTSGNNAIGVEVISGENGNREAHGNTISATSKDACDTNATFHISA